MKDINGLFEVNKGNVSDNKVVSQLLLHFPISSFFGSLVIVQLLRYLVGCVHNLACRYFCLPFDVFNVSTYVRSGILFHFLDFL